MESVTSADTWRLTLHQSPHGYRFALEVFLLADFVQEPLAGPIMDLGTGCGVVALLLARRFPQQRLVGLELQPTLAAMAQRNIICNDLQERLEIVQGDIRQVPRLFQGGTFGTVVCNPPYRAVGHGRLNPHPEKALARHELALSLPQLAQAIRHLLPHRGRCTLVYHPSRLAELCGHFEAAQLRLRRLRLVHTSLRTPASIVLVEASRDGREALTVLPPLTVYEAVGTYSAEMQDIFHGRSVPQVPYAAES
ncbi:MAG: tRNA1(Val) (adenine(37)-N6)-methyltransferase [Candidatus Tectimicrobiota bacterium]